MTTGNNNAKTQGRVSFVRFFFGWKFSCNETNMSVVVVKLDFHFFFFSPAITTITIGELMKLQYVSNYTFVLHTPRRKI